MREAKIEAYLRQKIRERGGLCWKITSPGLCGVPDRLVLLQDGWSCWVELKAPGRKARPIQKLRHAELLQRGHRVVVLDSIPAVDCFLERLFCLKILPRDPINKR